MLQLPAFLFNGEYCDKIFLKQKYWQHDEMHHDDSLFLLRHQGCEGLVTRGLNKNTADNLI